MAKQPAGPDDRKTLPGTRLGKDFLGNRGQSVGKFSGRSRISAVTESLGDTVGLNNVDTKRYTVLLQSADKGTRHGFDAVLQEKATGKLVVLEQKGQNAKESSGQRNPAKWIEKVNEKTIGRQGNYAKSTEHEVGVSRRIQEAMRNGQVEYQLQRTHADPATGKIHVDTVKRVQVTAPAGSRDVAEGGPVRTFPIPSDTRDRGAGMSDKKPVPPNPPRASGPEVRGFGELRAEPAPVPRFSSDRAGKGVSIPQPGPKPFVGLNATGPGEALKQGPPPKKAASPDKATAEAPKTSDKAGPEAKARSGINPSPGRDLSSTKAKLARLQGRAAKGASRSVAKGAAKSEAQGAAKDAGKGAGSASGRSATSAAGRGAPSAGGGGAGRGR